MGKYSSLFCCGIYAGDLVVHKLPLMWVAIWMKISNITYERVGWVIWRLCYPAFSGKETKSFITLTQGWNQLSKKLREWAVLVSFFFFVLIFVQLHLIKWLASFKSSLLLKIHLWKYTNFKTKLNRKLLTKVMRPNKEAWVWVRQRGASSLI
jgi:hypothetical protein